MDTKSLSSKGDRTIGDFSNWKQQFNYFNDFAPKRVGQFIQNFMDEIIKTKDVGQSLEFTVKKYIESNKIEADFYEIEQWWDDKR